MKVIANIPEDTIQELKDGCFGTKHTLYDLAGAICDGVVIPDKATNGDVIKAMFNCMVIDIVKGKVYVEKIYFPFDEGWWNAPYKGGEENGKQKNPTQK